MNNLELEITSKAYNDMEIISEFIAKDNKSVANKMIKLFYKTFETSKHRKIKTGFYLDGCKILCCKEKLSDCLQNY